MISIEEIKTNISMYKNHIYGIAAILVVLYHAYCVAGWTPFRAFGYGFIGVDIFLFIGAFTLCFSIRKNPISIFYINRLVRVYPLWFLTYIVWLYTLKTVYMGTPINLSELLWQSTIVLPLLFGESGCDWFTSSLLLYYAFSPVLYYILKNTKESVYFIAYFAMSALCLGILALDILPTWELNCCISRVPCFMFGIILFLSCSLRTLKFCSIISVIFAIASLYFKLRFLFAAMVVPLLVCIILAICKKCWVQNKITILLSSIGERSLEYYYGARGWNYLLGGGNFYITISR